MTPPTRPRRSRVGLTLFVVVLSMLAFEVVDLVLGDRQPPRATPLRMLTAAWDGVAGVWTGGGPLAASGGDTARLAFEPLPYVNYGLKPSFTREGDPLRSTNSIGFRGPDVTVPKPEGVFRIVCLGGSTTYSDAVADDETYPVQLQAMLRQRHPDRNIEVVNAGVPSYTTAESLANLAFRCLELGPDAIVVYHAANDYRPRSYPNFVPSYFHYRKVWDGTLAHRTQSDLPELQGGINSLIQLAPPEEMGNPKKNVERSGVGAYTRNLTSIAGIARAHGVRTVFVTFLIDPDHEWGNPESVAGIAEHNEAMLAVAKRTGALVVDLAGEMQPAGMFHDPVHLNAQGCKVKARVIANGLSKGLFGE